MLPHRVPTLRVLIAAVLLASLGHAFAADLPKVTKVELQPLGQQAKRVADALELLGVPLPEADRKGLNEAAVDKDQPRGVTAIQTILDRFCIAGVRVASSKLEVVAGPARPELAEQGWRVFLVKVENPSGIDKVELRPDSPNALPLTKTSRGASAPTVTSLGEVAKRFLDLQTYTAQPLLPDLSGLELEYRVLQVYCRDSGRKEATLGFALWAPGKKEPNLTSNQVAMLCESQPAVVVKLQVRDHDGKPTMAAFTFRDERGRIYPAMSRRLAPDFGFHPQIYRGDGETVTLQPGKYNVTFTRGPEYLLSQRQITIPTTSTHNETFDLKRWVHPAKKSWYSGDHHIHAAGCAHYESPTEGVAPSDMMRHVLGEDLNVGLCLSWGPCWYHQKRYFEEKTDKQDKYPVHALSTPMHLLRYDVEVSGFPSSPCGHICLIRLKKQDYPGTKLIEDWPSWDLPIFRWAKMQGGVVGFAHSGWGLEPEKGDPNTRELPNYLVPRMNSIGANEYLVDVAHGMCDFISTVDTPSVWELNIWYHTLNCGYRCRVSGETDFPCIYGDRVGLGRSYVHLENGLDFEKWAEGIKQGRCYVSDGKSHLMDFTVNGTGVGLKDSEVKLEKPGKVLVKANVAARLEPRPTPETERIRKAPLSGRPYWELERGRIGETRKVPVELIVNGHPVATKEIEADGSESDVSFDADIKESSWVALRIFPSSHTNPVFVMVDGKPIRTSKRSAEWCLKGIDNCWKEKIKTMRPKDQADAKAAYDQARDAYRKILAESSAE